MYDENLSVILAQQKNLRKGGRQWYEPQLINHMAREFVESVIRNDKVDWEAFRREANELYGPWTYQEVRDAFFSKLLDLGLLTTAPEWNYLIMTNDEFGSNPFFGYHLYFTRRLDALGYAIALYQKRKTKIAVFRLQA